MELALNNEYVNGTIALHDARLVTATRNIAKNMNASKDAFVKAGVELMKILDDKLYKKDFFDERGRPSFAMYVEMVLGISKTAAYRIMATTKKLLMPELTTHQKPEYFKNFADSTLGVLSNAKLGDYDSVKNFCIAFEITETTPRSDVEKYVKAYTRKNNPCLSLADYTRENNNGPSKTVDIANDDNGTDNNATSNSDNAVTYNVDDITYAVQVANILALVPDALEDTVSTDELKIIREFIKRFHE